MVDLSKYNFSFLNQNELSSLKKYIHKNWKKNHILSQSTNLLKWQHLSGKKLNFFCCKKKSKIIGILGVINFYKPRCKSKVIGLGIWSTNKNFRNIGGVIFFKFLETFRKEKILATGLNELSIKYYKFFGFKIDIFKKYYICPLSYEKQTLTKNLVYSRPSKDNYIKKISYYNFYKKFKNLCIKSFVKYRYENHPYYKHFIITDIRYKIYFVARVVKVGKMKYLRILDYYGDFKNLYLKNSLSRFCEDNDFHHLEFLHFGDDKKYIIQSGFNLCNDKKSILPILSEPFIGLKNSNINIAYKNFNHVKIVKGDVDADRPNQLKKR